MALEVYKKIRQSDKREKRSVDVTSDERTHITNVNNKFVELFKLKHLS
jgi:hypothetical protein